MKIFRQVLLALILTTPAAAAPLIVNGGFETGAFTAWTQSGNTEYTSVFNQDYDGLSPQKGVYYALLGPAGGDGILTQSFTDAPGAALRISFWLASNGGTPSDFSATFDGRALVRLANVGTFGWTEYTAKMSGTGHDALSFSFCDDQDYFALDDIGVTQADPVPEPAGVLLFLVGLLATIMRRRR